MNVKLYGTSAVGRDFSFYRTASSVPEPAKQQTAESAGSYDKLTLHNKTQYPSDTKQFARLLAKETAKEISAPADNSRVEELRHQAEAGTYIPDAGQIAKHMLCY